MDATSIAILLTAIGGLITGLMAQFGSRKAQKDDHFIDQNKQLFSNVDQVVQSLRDELDRVLQARSDDQQYAREQIRVCEQEVIKLRRALEYHAPWVDTEDPNLGMPD